MNTKRITLICAVLVLFLGLIHNNAHGELPADFPGISVTTYDPCAVADGYVFLAIATETPGIGTYLMILENDGSPYWFRKVDTHEIYDFKVLPNGFLHYAPFIEVHSFAGGGDVTHEILDPDYNYRETIQAGNGYIAESHDFQMLPNGHVLLFGYYLMQVDMSEVVPGGYPNAVVAGTAIQELDAERNVVFQWRNWDHTTLEEYFRTLQNDPKAKNPVINAFHLNSIDLDTDGHILISTPQGGANLSATSGWIEKINRQTGETMWHLGGTDNQFTFVGVSNAEGLQSFSGHGFNRLPNGNVLIYDNGSADKTRTSRVYEFELDETNKVATYVWSYTPPAVTSGNQRGNAQRLPNGNTFIGWGGLLQIPAATEVTPAGQIVFDLKFDDPRVGSYRAFRSIWPPVQTNTVKLTELATGNTYIFADDDVNTGVTLEVLSGGGGYNEVTVTREPYAPVYPVFPGKAPRALPVRVKVDGYNIGSMTAEISFDANSFGFAEPNKLTVYHRQFPGQGLFIPLSTDYNPVTKQLQATMTKFGEFIFCYPDIEDVPYPPMLAEVENYRGVQTHEVIAPKRAAPGLTYQVNQERDILLSWSPKGFARWYQLQVATDANFTNVVLDDDYLTEARYIWDTAEPNTTYYYRVNTTNEGGTSEWSAGSFATVPPMIEVTVPSGGENWKRGVKYFIKWNDNIAEDVVIELYKGQTLVQTIGTVPSDRAYQWQVGLGLAIGCDYSIKIKSSTNGALFDMSKTFSIDVPTGDFDCDGCVGIDDLAVLAGEWLEERSGLMADLHEDGKVNFLDFAVFGGIWPGP